MCSEFVIEVVLWSHLMLLLRKYMRNVVVAKEDIHDDHEKSTSSWPEQLLTLALGVVCYKQ